MNEGTKFWLARAGRMTVFGVCVTSGVAAFAASEARGQMNEQMLDLGANMMMYRNADWQSGVRELRINEQRLFASTGIAQQPFGAILDHFESICDEHDGGFGERVSELGRETTHRQRRAQWAIRYDLGNEGYVACLDLGTDNMPASELMARVHRFEQSQDLRDLGGTRYVYAKTNEAGESMFLAFWTDGSFRLDALTAEGDALGGDLEGVPRPPGSRRNMTMREAGVSHRVTMYEGSPMTGWELAAYYRDALPASGYHILVDPDRAEAGEVSTVAAERDGKLLYVMLTTDPSGHGAAALLSDE